MPAHDLERLWALARGRLSSTEAEEARAHVRECASCARELSAIESATNALAKLQVPERPAAEWSELDARVLRAARQRLERRGLLRWWDALASERWLALGALTAVAALIALFVLRIRSSMPDGTTPPDQAPIATSPRQQPARDFPLPPQPAPALRPDPNARPPLKAPASARVVAAIAAETNGGRGAALQPDRLVPGGSTVSTGDRGEAVLALPEGSIIALQQTTATRLAAVEPDAVRIELERGEVVIAASHRAGRSFEVVAGATTVRVVGTRFSVQRDEDATRVRVTEGRVRVTGAGGTQHDVSAGQELTLSSVGARLDALADDARHSLSTVIARLESLMRPARPKPQPTPEPEQMNSPPAPSVVGPEDEPTDTWAQPFVDTAPDAGVNSSASANAATNPTHPQATARTGQPWLDAAVDGMQKWLDVDWDAPFPPVGMSMVEYRVRQMERLADAGRCTHVLRRADEWEATYVVDAGVPPDRTLHRTVELTRARCLEKLGRSAEAENIRRRYQP